ncbi:MAG: AzlC family ABC transporter permease [Lachnospiraceae bacterium]|nr:AzlC family ABC transporter permease [Lachnospiraceae bacterium]
MDIENFKSGLRDGIPIALGYFAVSFTFGIMAASGGLSPWQAALISLTNLTSAGQFAGLEIIIAGGSYFEMVLTELIINLRYCLMSFSLSQKLEQDCAWGHRFLVAFGITDEIFGVSASREGKLSPYYNYGAMCVAIPGWVLGTLLGAVSGSLLPAFLLSALGVAIYGMFLAVIIPPAKTNRAVLGVVIGAMAVSSLFAYAPLLKQVSSGFVIIITTVVVAGAAAYFCPIKEEPSMQEAGYEPETVTGSDSQKQNGKEESR